MSYLYFIGVAVLLGCLYAWIGIRASKSVQTSEDYFLMGRKLTFLPLCLTLLATQLGGGSLLGAAQEAYLKGWVVLIYPLGAAIGFVILGMGFGAKLRKLDISTIAEVFEKIYGSRSQRLIASGLSIVSFFFILVGQGIAARKFFLTIDIGETAFILFWLGFVAYTVMGGLKAVVDTDIVQALLIIVGLVVAWLSIDWSLLSATTLPVSKAEELTSVPWSSWLLMPLLFMLIEQDIGQRCFAAKTPAIVRPSAIVAGVLVFGSSVVAIGFGVLARSLNLDVGEQGSVLIEAVKVLTNPMASILFMGAILMAIASTADSILCSISSNLSCDLLAFDRTSEQKKINISRLLTLITGLGALGAGYLFDNIVTVLMLAYELSVCVLFVPVVATVVSKQPSRMGAYISMATGGIGFVLFRILPMPLPKEVLTLALSGVGYGVGQRVSRTSNQFEVKMESSNG